MEKRYTFKEHKLSEPERLWLEEVAAAKGEFNVKVAKVKLLDKLPKDFDPNKIDRRLYSGGKLGIIGLRLLRPGHPIFDGMDEIIRAIRNSIIEEPSREKFTSKEIAESTGLDEKLVAQALKQLSNLGRFWASSGGPSNSEMTTEIHLSGDEGYDEYFNYEGLDELLEKYYKRHALRISEEENLVNNPLAQNSVDMLKERRGIPSEEEIKQLSRWAQVAFAARCAKRVQPLFNIFWPKAPKRQREAIENAIKVSEKAADERGVFTELTAKVAAREARTTRDFSLRKAPNIAASYVPNSARGAADAADAASNHSPDLAKIVLATIERAIEAASAAGIKDAISLAISKDFDALILLEKKFGWDDQTNYSSLAFGQMWPEGEPNWKELATQIENTDKKRAGSQSKIINNEELRSAFEEFLVSKKGYSQKSLRPVPYLGEDEYRPNCVTEVIEDHHKVLALITFRISKDEYNYAFQDMLVYEEAINMSDVPKYIVYAEKSSKHTFTIYEYGETEEKTLIQTEAFPAYKQMLFESPLNGPGRRICRDLIELARVEYQLSINAVCKDYINLQIKKNNRTAAQIHRLNDSDGNIALVLAGYQSVFPNPTGGIYITKGDLNQLSGNVREYPREIAWLNGNVNHKRLRFRATVYVIMPGALFLEDVNAEVKRLLDLAIKNAGNGREIEDTETKNGSGTIATMASDKASKEDLLGRTLLAQSLAKMFVHTKDIEGLTVALLGDWGEGKSTVMNLVKNELKDDAFEFAEFNAWEYEHTDNIAAGLAQEVLKGLLDFKNNAFISFIKRLWLRIRFACKVHLSEMIGLFGCVILAAMGVLLLTWKDEISFLGVTITSVGLLPILLKIYDNYRRAQSHSVAVQMLKYLKLPEYHKHLGLIPALKKDIQILCDLRLKRKNKKLLVFVDDLDRCQPECISKTLDAIRLVMSIPNVIVMISIDHRIAFKAVEKTYEELSDYFRSEADIARDYLGKIILLPVRLTATGATELQQYVNKKLYPDAEESASEQKTASAETVTDDSKSVSNDREEAGATSGTPGTQNLDSTEDSFPPQPVKEKPEEKIEEAMRETTEERDRFYDLAINFEFSNPRQLLRLRNCYRLLKALNIQEKYPVEKILTTIFWQEFLHSLRREIRDICMASIIDTAYIKKIEDNNVKLILEHVREEIAELFQPDGEYARIASFVRCVVLPHSQEGVLDTSKEIEEWIGSQKGSTNKRGQTDCPLGLKWSERA